MLIINQKRSELINLDNIIFIAKEEKGMCEGEDFKGQITYYGFGVDDYKFNLGTYTYTKGHENLIEKIAKSIGATEVFYMPEE